MRTVAEQFADFIAANENSAFPDNIEGYWRQELNLPAAASSGELDAGKDFWHWDHNQQWKFPFPVVYTPEGDYKKALFLLLLKEMEASPFTEKTVYRGFSRNRLTGESNGNVTYERDGWKWPSGYITYIRMDVPPSRAFYKFVTSLDAECLPSYGRE